MDINEAREYLNGLSKRKRHSQAEKNLMNNLEKVTFLSIGNFTVAIAKSIGEYYIGVAKRRPDDNNDSEVGQKIALARAIRREQGQGLHSL